MSHGNQNTHFQMTVTHWHATNFDIAFDTFYLMLPTPCLLFVTIFLILLCYLCLFIISGSESWRCRFDSLLFDSSLTHIAATLLTHSTAVVLTHSIAILIVLPHWCSIYSGQSCRLIDNPFTWTFALKPSKTIQVQDLHSSRLIWLWTFETTTVDDYLNCLKS